VQHHDLGQRPRRPVRVAGEGRARDGVLDDGDGVIADAGVAAVFGTRAGKRTNAVSFGTKPSGCAGGLFQ
jgi:hypothetical protein